MHCKKYIYAQQNPALIKNRAPRVDINYSPRLSRLGCPQIPVVIISIASTRWREFEKLNNPRRASAPRSIIILARVLSLAPRRKPIAYTYTKVMEFHGDVPFLSTRINFPIYNITGSYPHVPRIDLSLSLSSERALSLFPSYPHFLYRSLHRS